MKREEVLAEARKCVCGDRDKNYGSPENSFEYIAEMWTAYLRQRGLVGGPKFCPQKNEDSNKVPTSESRITAWDVAWMMVLLKASRAAGNTSYIDGCIDAAGYAACAGETLPPVLRLDQLAATSHFKVGEIDQFKTRDHFSTTAKMTCNGGCTGC